MNSADKFRSIRRFVRNTDVLWRYGLNLSPSMGYRFAKTTGLTVAETRVINELDSAGIAISSVDKLFGSDLNLRELDSEVGRILEIRKDEIDSLRSLVDDESEIGSKTFNLEILDSELKFDAKCVFARFALNRSLLNIANAYFGMYAKLRYYNVWQTFASNGSPRESQLWHFDREDNYILKVFLYLEDVDEGAGPFTYAPGTHKKGRYRNITPEYFLEGGVRRTTDDQMKAVFPQDRWIRALGKKGTVVFADTRGFHKGGEARTKDRLMYTCMYTSPASESKNLIKFGDNFDRSTLDARQLRALGVK